MCPPMITSQWALSLLESTNESACYDLHSRFVPNASPPSDGRCLLQALPNELLGLIVHLLPIPNAICLALTSLSFWQLVRSSRDIQIPRQFLNLRIDLALLLERGLPNHLACEYCARLYEWRKQKTKNYECPNTQHRSSERQCFDDHQASNTHPGYFDSRHFSTTHQQSLGWFADRTKGAMFPGLRRLVLRHELLGPQHGLPVSAIAQLYRAPERGPNMFESGCVVQPKIVHGGKLMVHITLWASLNILTPSPAPDKLASAVCLHLSQSLRILMKGVAEALLGARKTGMSSNRLWYRCKNVLKCFSCATDLRLYIRHFHGKTFEVKIDVYKDYGALEGRLDHLPERQRELFEITPFLQANGFRLDTTITEKKVKDRLYQNLEKHFNSNSVGESVTEVTKVGLNGQRNRMSDLDGSPDVAFARLYYRSIVMEASHVRLDLRACRECPEMSENLKQYLSVWGELDILENFEVADGKDVKFGSPSRSYLKQALHVLRIS